MLDINFIRENVETVKQGMINKGEKEPELVDQVLAKDEEWRAFVHKLDTLRSENNAKAKQIGMLMGQGKKEEAQAIIKETGQFKEEVKALEEKERILSEERDSLLYKIAMCLILVYQLAILKMIMMFLQHGEHQITKSGANHIGKL